MCGRYASTLPAEAMRALFRPANPAPAFAPSWNVAPGREAPVLRRHPETGLRHLDLLRWGLVPHWLPAVDQPGRPPPINARAETVAALAMFRSAFAARRCLVVATAFYEWRRQGRGPGSPHAFARRDGGPLALGGIWEGWRGPAGEVLRTFAILTTAANATVAPIHHRMPLIIEAADWPLWLGEAAGDPAPLLAPAAEAVLRAWPVGPAVNSPRHDGPALLEPAMDSPPA